MAERTLSKRSAGGACGAGAAAGEEARLCAMAQTKLQAELPRGSTVRHGHLLLSCGGGRHGPGMVFRW
jgi:hypothetical protein